MKRRPFSERGAAVRLLTVEEWQYLDGIRPLFDDDPVVPGGAPVAAAMWETARTAAWRYWLRTSSEQPLPQPPQGAITFDGISGGRRAVASVAAFRKARPKEAATVELELSAFLNVVAVELARQADDRRRLRDSFGQPAAAETVEVDDDPDRLWTPTLYEPPVPFEPVSATVIPIRPLRPGNAKSARSTDRFSPTDLGGHTQ